MAPKKRKPSVDKVCSTDDLQIETSDSNTCTLSKTSLDEISSLLDSKIATLKQELMEYINVEITKVTQKFEDRIVSLESSKNDFIVYKTTTDSTMSELHAQVKGLEETVKSLVAQKTSMKNTLNTVEADVKQALVWANEIEQYGRRWMVRVHGVKETDKENCVQLVKALFQERLEVTVADSDIEAAHRVGRVVPNKTRGIIVRFARRDVKWKIIENRRKLQSSGMSIMEDLTNLNMKLINRLNNSELIEKCWATNGKVFGLLPNVKNKIRFFPYETIEDTIAKFMN